jgi:hypothetical protein
MNEYMELSVPFFLFPGSREVLVSVRNSSLKPFLSAISS